MRYELLPTFLSVVTQNRPLVKCTLSVIPYNSYWYICFQIGLERPFIFARDLPKDIFLEFVLSGLPPPPPGYSYLKGNPNFVIISSVWKRKIKKEWWKFDHYKESCEWLKYDVSRTTCMLHLCTQIWQSSFFFYKSKRLLHCGAIGENPEKWFNISMCC